EWEQKKTTEANIFNFVLTGFSCKIIDDTYNDGKRKIIMAKMKAPVQKNQRIEVQFIDMTHEGNGVAKVDGYPVFVPYGLPGETAEVKIIKVKKNFAFGKLLKTKIASSDRVT